MFLHSSGWSQSMMQMLLAQLLAHKAGQFPPTGGAAMPQTSQAPPEHT